MVEPVFDPEQRKMTIEMLLGDLSNYRKRDRKFFEKSGSQDPMWYLLSSPPYPAKFKDFKELGQREDPLLFCGNHPRLESRLILFPNYLMFLTEWTPEKAQATKKMTLGSFTKDVLSEGFSELTWGVSDIVGWAASKAVPQQAMKLLGKGAEEMMLNPWSRIVPLEDIADFTLEKSSFFYHYLYLHVNHRYEGEMDLGLTYHLSGLHWRADDLYKKLSKLIG